LLHNEDTAQGMPSQVRFKTKANVPRKNASLSSWTMSKTRTNCVFKVGSHIAVYLTQWALSTQITVRYYVGGSDL